MSNEVLDITSEIDFKERYTSQQHILLLLEEGVLEEVDVIEELFRAD